MIACNKGTYDYSFAPDNPRAGETVTFTNLSTAGDDWTWQFGDGAVSTLKNPTHVFKRVGTFNVTLMVDSSQHKTVVKQITVYDTVPSFAVSADSLLYMHEVSFTALVYNPYNKPVNYRWQLPDCAVVTSADLSSEQAKAYFTRPDTTVDVSLHVTFDGTETTITRQVKVNDAKAAGLWLAMRTDGNIEIKRQRLFDVAPAAAHGLLRKPASSSASRIDRLLCFDEKLLLFEAGMPQCLSLLPTLEISTPTTEAIPLLEGEQKESRGDIFQKKLYLTVGSGNVYAADLPLSGKTTIAEATDLYLSMPYDILDIRFAADNVAYLLTADSIVKLVASVSPATLRSQTVFRTVGGGISAFSLDPTGQKLYIIDSGTLTVCSTDGTNPQPTDIKAACLNVEAQQGVLYFADSEAVYWLPLVYNPQNNFNAGPLLVARESGVTALCYDEHLR